VSEVTQSLAVPVKPKAAVAKTKPAVSDLTMTPQKFIEAALASKLFKDTADAAQAYVKITLGASLNLDPVTSMASIYIVQGKPSLSANLLAARINQSGYGRYEVLEKTPEKCRIQFYRLVDDWTADGKVVKKWIKPGPPEEYNLQLAQKAGLTKNPVWQNHGMNMNFARCMSNGTKTYFPELLNGVPIYTPDELDPNLRMAVTADGEVIPDAEYSVSPPPSPKTDRTAEILALMQQTKTDEKGWLTALFGKPKASELTGTEQDKAVAVLKSKLAATPQPF
jgi:hypothetical protein